MEGLGRRVPKRAKHCVHPRLIARTLTFEPLEDILIES